MVRTPKRICTDPCKLLQIQRHLSEGLESCLKVWTARHRWTARDINSCAVRCWSSLALRPNPLGRKAILARSGAAFGISTFIWDDQEQQQGWQPQAAEGLAVVAFERPP